MRNAGTGVRGARHAVACIPRRQPTARGAAGAGPGSRASGPTHVLQQVFVIDRRRCRRRLRRYRRLGGACRSDLRLRAPHSATNSNGPHAAPPFPPPRSQQMLARGRVREAGGRAPSSSPTDILSSSSSSSALACRQIACSRARVSCSRSPPRACAECMARVVLDWCSATFVFGASTGTLELTASTHQWCWHCQLSTFQGTMNAAPVTSCAAQLAPGARALANWRGAACRSSPAGAHVRAAAVAAAGPADFLSTFKRFENRQGKSTEKIVPPRFGLSPDIPWDVRDLIRGTMVLVLEYSRSRTVSIVVCVRSTKKEVGLLWVIGISIDMLLSILVRRLAYYGYA